MNKKILAVVIPFVVVIVAAIGVLSYLLLTDGSNQNDLYLERIQTAEKYLSSNDYDNAILYYQKAIEADDTQEDAYIALANVYFEYRSNVDQALQILRQGFERTGSPAINSWIVKYENFLTNDTPEDNIIDDLKNNHVDSDSVISGQLVDIIATNTYKDYSTKYSVASDERQIGKYTVTYQQFPARFEYENQLDKDPIIDNSTGLPVDYARPTKIVFDDLAMLMPAVSNQLSVDKIRSYGVSHLDEKDSDSTVNSNYITFEFKQCEFTIGVDSNRNVIYPDGYNAVVPPENTVKTAKQVTLTGSIADVTNGRKVNGATVTFYKGKAGSSEKIDADSISGGVYSVMLEPGDYEARVEADGYITEDFSFTLSDTSDRAILDFNISPSLSTGQIRIVLEWGANPADLDSHLKGTSSDGRSVNVDFTSRISRNGDKVYAELDIDDQDGFGPETVTVNDVNGVYDYYVYLYHGEGTIAESGVTVKVYTTTSSTPIVFTPPAGHTGRQWDVFSINKGEISVNDAVAS